MILFIILAALLLWIKACYAKEEAEEDPFITSMKSRLEKKYPED